MQDIRKNGFFRNQEGAVGIILTVALFTVILMVIAGSIDTGKMQSGSLDNHSAVDAAALGTTDWMLKLKLKRKGEGDVNWRDFKPSAAEIKAYALGLYTANISDQGVMKPGSGADDFTVTVTNDSVKIKSCAEVDPQKLHSAVGLDKTGRVCAVSEAGYSIGEPGNLEIAISVDYTYSMYGNRINKAAEAITNISNKYLNGENNVYISLSPVTTFVSFYPFHIDLIEEANMPITLDPGSGWKTNVVDELPAVTTENFNTYSTSAEIKPLTGNTFFKFKRFYDGTNPVNSNLHYYSYSRPVFDDDYPVFRTVISRIVGIPSLNVQPLTDNPEVINRMISEIKSNVKKANVPGTSQGLSGIFSAWMTVAKGWQGKWRGPIVNGAYTGSFMEYTMGVTPPDRSALPSINSQKIIVYVGDGADSSHTGSRRNNFIGDEDRSTVAQRTPMYTELCKRIAQNGIRIYYVLYGPPSPEAEACVNTSPDHELIANITPTQIPDEIEQIIESNTSVDYNIKLKK